MPVNVGDMICNLDSEEASIVSEPNYCTKCSLFNKFFLVRNKLKIVASCRLEMCVMFHDAMVIAFPCSTTQIVFNKLQYEFMTRTLRYKHRKYLYLKLKSTQHGLLKKPTCFSAISSYWKGKRLYSTCKWVDLPKEHKTTGEKWSNWTAAKHLPKSQCGILLYECIYQYTKDNKSSTHSTKPQISLLQPKRAQRKQAKATCIILTLEPGLPAGPWIPLGPRIPGGPWKYQTYTCDTVDIRYMIIYQVWFSLSCGTLYTVPVPDYTNLL